MKQSILIICTILLFWSCQPEGRIYNEHQDLSPKIEWLESDKKTFKVPINETNINYKMSISFRYANGYQYETAMVKVTEISPSKKETVKEYDLKVREANGDYIGEPGYDIWDSEHLVEAEKKYQEEGTYTYIFEQNTPVDPLNFAMEIGLIIDKK